MLWEQRENGIRNQPRAKYKISGNFKFGSLAVGRAQAKTPRAHMQQTSRPSAGETPHRCEPQTQHETRPARDGLFR